MRLLKPSHVFVAALCTLPVTGFCDDGNALLKQLQSKDSVDNLNAYYYIRGVLDYEQVIVLKEATELAFSTANPKKTKFSMQMFCIPEGVRGKQVFDIVQQYLEANPSIRHHEALTSVRKSLLLTWPCRGNEDVGAK